MSELVAKTAAFIAAMSPSVKEKLFSLTTGWGLWIAFNWWYDNVLFTAGIAKWGLIKGGVIMTLSTIVVNFVWLAVYEIKKMRWVSDAEEALVGMFKWTKKIINYPYKNKYVAFAILILLFIPQLLMRLAIWCVSQGGWKAFLSLSCFTDSFVTIAYLMNGEISRSKLKDSGLYLLSTIAGCIYWSIRSYGLVIGLKIIWRMICYVWTSIHALF